ncbi:hypothetical protein BKA67DRAFT_530020 [Truncatella angustata]|uniref:Uncharacterized protein n=1 Tax=Truncatella angustata TaxID=152316 RepID=A0A9P8UXT2_9PEZI|nr:uncharacterized protein BKA67DRAFT_530020 [Truncatella angustata]KAH6659894.1 hypothetical protein BKA67DRAFT_530020 [Truncatella angustata]
MISTSSLGEQPSIPPKTSIAKTGHNVQSRVEVLTSDVEVKKDPTGQRPLLGDDRLYLPDSELYLTTTRSGKPAIARCKNHDILRHHGFDLLGQSFGIPSRADFERGRRPTIVVPKQRSRSAYSVPAPRVIEIGSDDEEGNTASKVEHIDDCVDQSSSGSSSRSTTTLKGILRSPRAVVEQEPLQTASPPLIQPTHRIRRRRCSFSHPPPIERSRFAVCDSEDDGFPVEYNVPLDSPGAFYTPLASPHHHVITGTMPNYHQPVTASQLPSVAWHSGPSSHPPSSASSNLSSNVLPQQTQPFGIQYQNVLGFGTLQPAPMGSIPHMQQQTTASILYPQPGFIPPPPPLPPGTIPLNTQPATGNIGTVHVMANEEERIKNHFESVVKPQLASNHKQRKKPKEQAPEDEQPQASVEKYKEGMKKLEQEAPPGTGIPASQEMLKDLPPKVSSDRLMAYTHVCAGCGKTRSQGYHMTHLLNKGEKPEADYCRRCIVNAEYTDSEAIESPPEKKILMTPGISVKDNSHGLRTPTSTAEADKSGHRKISHRKRSSRGSLLKTVSSILSSGSRSRRAVSLSSPEEASSRGSSRTGAPRVHRPDPTSSKARSNRISQQRSSLSKASAERFKPSASLQATQMTVNPTDNSQGGNHSQRELHRPRSPTRRTRAAPNPYSNTMSRLKIPNSSHSRVPNFSYKSSPLVPSTKNVQEGASGHLDPWYRQSLAHTEASETEAYAGNSEANKSHCNNHGTTSSGNILPSDQPGGQIGHGFKTAGSYPGPESALVERADSVDHLLEQANVQSSPNRSHVSQNHGGWDSLGIFNKAPDLKKPLDDHGGDTWNDVPIDIGESGHNSRHSEAGSGDSSKGYSNSPSYEGQDLFDQAPNSNDPLGQSSVREATGFGNASLLGDTSSRSNIGIPDPGSRKSRKRPDQKSDHQCAGTFDQVPNLRNVFDHPQAGGAAQNHDNLKIGGSWRESGSHGSSRREVSNEATLHEATGTFNRNPNFSDIFKRPQPDGGGFSKAKLEPCDSPYRSQHSGSSGQKSDTKTRSHAISTLKMAQDERGIESEPELSPDKDAFDSLPATPLDTTWGNEFEPRPYVQNDSWEYNQSHFEQQAEQMVEQMVEDELMHAESCASDEERTDGNARYQLSNESENEGSTAFDKDDIKQLEFLSHERPQSRRSSNKSHSRSSRDHSQLSSKHYSHTEAYAKSTRSHASSRNNMYEYPEDNNRSTVSNKSSFDFLPPAEGSSVLAHTGHSGDNIAKLGTLHDNTSTTSSTRPLRRRIRRFGL